MEGQPQQEETVLFTRTEPGFSWEEIDRAQKSEDQSPEVRKISQWLQQHRHIRPLQRCDIVEGVIQEITDKEVVIELEYKFNGVVPLTEFRDEPEPPREGQKVEVYVEKGEDRKGQVKLSRWKARMLRAWEKIRSAYEKGEVIEAEVIAKTRGGLVALCFGYECFLPGSQLDIEPVQDYDWFVGKKFPVKVVKINEAIMNAVVSRRAVLEEERERKKQELLETLSPGVILLGRVKSITDFGAFIDLGGLDGIVYTQDITWRRIRHPREVLQEGQEVQVVVLSFEREKLRLVLGMKQLEPNPWENLPETIREGARVKGKVVHIEPYGAFVEILPGVEGLIHVSEISWTRRDIDPYQYFEVGQEVEAVVIHVDRERRRIGLSIRQLEPDPWQNIQNLFPEGSRVKGKVVALDPRGVRVELQNGFMGWIAIQDISWTRQVDHPSEFFEVGQEIEAKVIGYDPARRLIKLGYKHLQEDPWPAFANVFAEGTIHTGTVKKIVGEEATIELPFDVEARAFLRDLKKQNGSFAQPGETLDFMVIRFDGRKRQIRVSHTRVWQEARKQAEARKKARQVFGRRERRKPAPTGGTPPERRKPSAPSAPPPGGVTIGELLDLEQLSESPPSEESSSSPPASREEGENESGSEDQKS